MTYKLYTQAMNYTDARRLCNSAGGHLTLWDR
jgi:hypothetical protein